MCFSFYFLTTRAYGGITPVWGLELTITITLTIAPVIPLQTVGWLRRYGNGVSSIKCGSVTGTHFPNIEGDKESLLSRKETVVS